MALPNLPPVRSFVKRLTALALDAGFPPVCLICNAHVSGENGICAECWPKITFISEPFCVQCGIPFEYSVPGLARCAGCIGDPPPFRAARSAFRYEDASKKIILSFKHGDALHALPALGTWLRQASSGLISECDVVVPVPLHRWRLISRRFNQSALLARHLAHNSELLYLPDSLIRTRDTKSQGRMSRSQRARNVQGAFAVPKKKRSSIIDRRVLLVDDVMTTGATARSCAKTLIRAGARSVDLITLARVF